MVSLINSCRYLNEPLIMKREKKKSSSLSAISNLPAMITSSMILWTILGMKESAITPQKSTIRHKIYLNQYFLAKLIKECIGFNQILDRIQNERLPSRYRTKKQTLLNSW